MTKKISCRRNCACLWLRKGSDVVLLTKFVLDYLGQPWLLDAVAEAALAWLQAMDDFLRLCYTADRIFLTASQSQAAFDYLTTFARHYHSCATMCHSRSLLFFNLTPKFHYMLHVRESLMLQSDQLYYLNPAVFSTQMAEDYVGVVSRSSRTCHPLGVPLRVGQKWRLYTKLRWMRP